LSIGWDTIDEDTVLVSAMFGIDVWACYSSPSTSSCRSVTFAVVCYLFILFLFYFFFSLFQYMPSSHGMFTIDVSEGDYEESMWDVTNGKAVVIDGAGKTQTYITAGGYTSSAFIVCTSSLEIGNMTISLISMRDATNNFFVSFSGMGTFTVGNCVIRMGKPFASYLRTEKAWNSTFISLGSGGTFNLLNTDFENIIVSGTNTFISSDVGSGKTLTIDGCTFTGCGCLGGGKVIYVKTLTPSGSETTLDVENSKFYSCFGYDGGYFILFLFILYIRSI
jgi:hypothetical protein